MLRFALRRLLWTVPVVLVAITIAFFLVRATGGDPFRHGPLLGLTGAGGWQTLFVVEAVFAIPGLARHYVSAAAARDYPLVLGMTVVLTMAVVLANLVVDLVLATLDPRLREGRGGATQS